MTQAPPLNGQVIGQAERATRAVLDVLLAAENTSFVNWVTLNLTATQDDTKTEALVDQLVNGLRIDQTEARAAVDEVDAAGLVSVGDRVRLTTAGEAKYARISAGIADIAARLYHDLAHDDLVIARRVLETLTDRARAELATAS
jgi:DNA-binding MarR family transcriptional regulator